MNLANVLELMEREIHQDETSSTASASARLVDLSLRPKYTYIDCNRIIQIYNDDYMKSYLPKRKINLDSIGICIEPRLAHGYHLMGMVDALVLAMENQYSSFEVFPSRPLIETYQDPLYLFPGHEDDKHSRKFNQHYLITSQTRSVMSSDYKLLSSLTEGFDYVILSNLVILLPPSFQTVDGLLNSIMRKTDDSSTNLGKKEKFFTMIANAGVIGHNQDELLRYFIAFAMEKIVTRRFLVGNKVRKDSKKRKYSEILFPAKPANPVTPLISQEQLVADAKLAMVSLESYVMAGEVKEASK